MDTLFVLLIVIFAVLAALVFLLKLWLIIRRCESCERLAHAEEEALIRQPPRALATIYKSTLPRHQSPPPAYY